MWYCLLGCIGHMSVSSTCVCVFRVSPSHSSLLLPGYWKPPSPRERMVRWSLHFHHTHFHCFTECSLHRCNFLLNGCGLSNTQSKPLLFRHDNTRSVFISKRKIMWCTGRFLFFFLNANFARVQSVWYERRKNAKVCFCCRVNVFQIKSLKNRVKT